MQFMLVWHNRTNIMVIGSDGVCSVVFSAPKLPVAKRIIISPIMIDADVGVKSWLPNGIRDSNAINLKIFLRGYFISRV